MATHPLRVPFARRLRQAVDSSGLSVADVAERSGYNKTTVQRWIKGPREPSASKLAALCSVLDVSADWMLSLSANGNGAPPFRNPHERTEADGWLP